MQKTYLDCSSQKWMKRATKHSGLMGSSFDLHFDEIKGTMVDSTFKAVGGMLSWKINYENKGVPPPGADLASELPVLRPEFGCREGELRFTWLGHSTAVISTSTLNFLIDPVFAQRCSPVSFAGPERIRPVPCTIEELPRIDVVMISHDHYDHWDEAALQRINDLHKPLFISGLDSEDALPKGCKAKCLDWTEFVELEIWGEKVRITFVPVCHWGRRGVTDFNKRLWGGFVVELPQKHRFFYSGDTGYCDVFKEIGEYFGGFDLAVLPIGAYHPRQLLKPQHVDPSEAVTIHKQLKSKQSVGVHWGTFPLGYEHYLAPKKDLAQSLEKQGLKPQEFRALCHGESLAVKL